jgi:hypothetical protein
MVPTVTTAAARGNWRARIHQRDLTDIAASHGARSRRFGDFRWSA